MEHTRTELINFLIKRYYLKCYLEIGCQTNINFNAIECVEKFSVDPDPNAGASYCMTSDEYFSKFYTTVQSNYDNINLFDIIFIDGLHHADQVKRDFDNSLRIIKRNGLIIIHDCNPPTEDVTHVPRDSKIWYGDVYKFAATIKSRIAGSFWTVDIDCGCGVFHIGGSPMLFPRVLQKNDTWDYFDENRKELLNLISWDKFIEINS